MPRSNNLPKAMRLIWSPAWLVLVIICWAPVLGWFGKQAASGGNPEALENCLCQLKGLIDDCSCSVESIDNFNNVHVYPLLNSLLKRDFFRYWKVNLQKPCPFWPDDGRCAMRYCSVEKCEAPPGLIEDEKPDNNKEDCTGDEHLGDLDPTISPESQAGFEKWAAHDSARDDSFCEPEDDKSSDSSYVDLLANPERYTGYAGASAHRVWKSIYGENCFSTGPDSASSSSSSPFAHLTDTKGLCLEKRTFFRAISGLHASINVHLSARYLLDGEGVVAGGTFRVENGNGHESCGLSLGYYPSPMQCVSAKF